MTPFAKWCRDAFEKVVGRFDEGPDPPARIGQLVVEFFNANPRLTRKQAVTFCHQLAATTYRAAYVRGWEHTIRDPQANWRKYPPELMADLEDPDWRWRPALGDELANPEDFVEDEVPAAPIEIAGHHRNRPPEDPDR